MTSAEVDYRQFANGGPVRLRCLMRLLHRSCCWFFRTIHVSQVNAEEYRAWHGIVEKNTLEFRLYAALPIETSQSSEE